MNINLRMMKKIEILKLDEDIEKKQKEQLRALKTDRNQKEVYYSLERLKKSCLRK